MEEDLLAILDEEDTQIIENVQNNVTLLDETEKEPEISLRTPEAILNDYTKLNLEAEKIQLSIEEFKAQHADIFKVLEDFNKELELAKEKQDGLKEELVGSMNDTNIKNISNDKFKVTYVAATQKSTFDRKAFETKYPVLCKQFLKYSDVKAYVKISEVKK